MVTTIQISESLRDNLLEFKETSKTSYEEVIIKLLNNYKKNKKEEEKMLIKSYCEMQNLTKEINENWEDLDLEVLKNFKD